MPTHLIYSAWVNMGKKVSQKTKDSKGNEVTRIVKFADPMEHKHMEKYNGLCFLCGEKMEKGIPVKKVFSSVFTDWNAGKSRESTHVCPACCFTILTGPERRALRNFSHVANRERLYLPNREELREFLLNPPEPPFVINIAVSQKKHIAFKGEINYSRDIFTVMYEEMPVIINRFEFKKILDLVEHFLFGFTKTEISTGQYNQKRILDFGVVEWQEFENRVKKYRGTPLLDVVMFVAQKKENEEELRCYMVSELKIETPQPQPSLSTRYTGVETEKEGRLESICGGKSNVSPKSVQNEQLALDLF